MILNPFSERRYDVDRLLKEAEKVIEDNPWGPANQLCLVNSSETPDAYEGIGNKYRQGYPMYGRNENDFRCFNKNYGGGVLQDLYDTFPAPVSRMRLMRVPPKKCLSMHSDGEREVRFHIAIKTNPMSFFLYQEDLKLMHIPADGHIYRFEVDKPHSAVNFSDSEERIHIVLNLRIF